MGKSACARMIEAYVCEEFGVEKKKLYVKTRANRLSEIQSLFRRLLHRFGCEQTSIYRRVPAEPMFFGYIPHDLLPKFKRSALEIKLKNATGFSLSDYLDANLEDGRISVREFVLCSRVLGDPRYVLSWDRIINEHPHGDSLS